MATAKTLSEMTPKSKKLVILAMYLTNLNFMLMSYSCALAHPAKLGAIGALGFYALANALSAMGMMSTLPFSGKLGDMFGRKWLTIGSVAIHFVLFALAGFSTTPLGFLIPFCLAGCAAGFFMPAPYAIMADVSEPKQRPKLYGFLATTSAIGCIVGPVVSGQLVGHNLFNYSYVVGLPLAVIIIVLLATQYPNIKHQATAGRKMDVLGIFLLVFTVAAITGYLNFGGKQFAFGSALGLGILAAGAVLLIILIVYESKNANPSVPVKLFLRKPFAIAFISMLTLSFFVTSSAGYIILFAQNGMGISAELSSTIVMPQTICQALVGTFIGAFFAKNVAKRLKPLYLTSLFLGGAALIIWSMLGAGSSIMFIYLGSLIGGVGYAISQAVFTPYFQTCLVPAEYGQAQSLYSFASSAGSCLFSAIAGVIMNNSGLDLGSSIAMTFRIGGISIAVALVIAILFIKMPKPAADTGSAG